MTATNPTLPRDPTQDARTRRALQQLSDVVNSLLRLQSIVQTGANTFTMDPMLQDIVALTDPGADRIVFWDDSAGHLVFLSPGTNSLTITTTTIAIADRDFGDITVGSSGTAMAINANAVTDTKLRDSAAYSVIGRNAGTSGDPADIAASANDRLLSRVSNILGFGQLTIGMFTDDLVTYAKLQNVSAAARLLGRGGASGAGDVEELALGTGLTMPATTLLATYNLGAAVALTIASGAVTKTGAFHKIDTEAAAASDDLDTINGGAEGDLLVLRATNGARDVVCKDGTGNLQLNGDFTLNNVQDTIKLIFDGSNWLELSRSDNGA